MAIKGIASGVRGVAPEIQGKYILILVLVFSLFCFSGLAFSLEVSYPEGVFQGGIYKIVVYGDDNIISISGTFDGSNIYFNETETPGTFFGLMGVNLVATPGTKRLKLKIRNGDGTNESWGRELQLKEGDFAVQRLTLDSKWTSYDDETMARINRENKIIGDLFRKETPDKLWSEPFMMPMEGRISGEFGLRRYINGEPRSPHSGIDIVDVTGTPISAANDGEVALTMDMFFSGLSLFIDHGQGLYTMYFHLSEVLVNETDKVKKGETVALVGATGRVTGAHLHFGVRLNYNKVSPWDLVNLEID